MEIKPVELIQGIDTVIVRVSNIEFSRHWYQNKLGLGLLFEDAGMNLAVLNTNGPTSLTLWQTDGPISANRGTASYPIFKTSDALALHNELSGRGIEVEEVIQDGSVSYFFFSDPDGNILEACQVSE